MRASWVSLLLGLLCLAGELLQLSAAGGASQIGVCIRNCAQCKKMFGAYFEGQLCADTCLKFKGKLIPDCEDVASIGPFLNRIDWNGAGPSGASRLLTSPRLFQPMSFLFFGEQWPFQHLLQFYLSQKLVAPLDSSSGSLAPLASTAWMLSLLLGATFSLDSMPTRWYVFTACCAPSLDFCNMALV